VAYGSKVVLEDVEEGESVSYEIVFPEEVDASRGRISLSSPIGRALVSKGEGDEVEVHTPKGKRTYQIVGLVTFHERAELATTNRDYVGELFDTTTGQLMVAAAGALLVIGALWLRRIVRPEF